MLTSPSRSVRTAVLRVQSIGLPDGLPVAVGLSPPATAEPAVPRTVAAPTTGSALATQFDDEVNRRGGIPAGRSCATGRIFRIGAPPRDPDVVMLLDDEVSGRRGAPTGRSCATGRTRPRGVPGCCPGGWVEY